MKRAELKNHCEAVINRLSTEENKKKHLVPLVAELKNYVLICYAGTHMAIGCNAKKENIEKDIKWYMRLYDLI